MPGQTEIKEVLQWCRTPAHGQEGVVAADQMEVAAHEHHGASKSPNICTVWTNWFSVLWFLVWFLLRKCETAWKQCRPTIAPASSAPDVFMREYQTPHGAMAHGGFPWTAVQFRIYTTKRNKTLWPKIGVGDFLWVRVRYRCAQFICDFAGGHCISRYFVQGKQMSLKHSHVQIFFWQKEHAGILTGFPWGHQNAISIWCGQHKPEFLGETWKHDGTIHLGDLEPGFATVHKTC